MTSGIRCPRCGDWTHKATEAEALADCPERDYEAEKLRDLTPPEGELSATDVSSKPPSGDDNPSGADR